MEFSLHPATNEEATQVLSTTWKESGVAALISEEGVFIAQLKPGANMGAGMILETGYFAMMAIIPVQLFKLK
jgi:hypothetical protein